MNDMIRQMVQPLLDAFDMYQVCSPALAGAIADFKARLKEFAESHGDIATYYAEFTASGLQEEYTDLISKAAVSSYNNSNAGDAASKAGGVGGDSSSEAGGDYAEVPTISVRDFLEQYRPAYNEVMKRGSERGQKAYDEVFNVANRTDDMLEAQIILEKERLLWRIVSEDALDIFEKKLEKMDPLFLATTAVLVGQINAYNKANSEEELECLLGIQEVAGLQVIATYTCRMNVAAMLAKELTEFIKAKEMVYDWFNDNGAQKGVEAMLEKRRNIRSLVAFMKEELGITPADLFDDPGSAIWMLSPQNLDEFGRRRRVNNPENLDMMRDVLENEILADLSPRDILLRA